MTDSIHYSAQPDTLHLPGQGAGVNLKEVNLPLYYRKNFFSADTLLRGEPQGGRYGVAGDPLPYAMRNDDAVTSLLLALLVMSLIATMRSRRFIGRQLKSLFYAPHSENVTVIPETGVEMGFQTFLVAVTCVLLALLAQSYAQKFVAQTFMLPTEYHLAGIFLALFAAYFLLRRTLYEAVNRVFFDRRRNRQWTKTLLFITASEGILLFPAVMVYVYFDMPLESVLTYFTIVLVFVKIFTFYKCFDIFFRQNKPYLQIFLYFCALEIVPLASLWGVLAIVGNNLKVNF